MAALIAQLGIDAARVAVERNQDVVPRRTWAEAHARRRRQGGDRRLRRRRLGRPPERRSDAPATIRWSSAGRTFKSRLLVGTGKYATIEQGREAILRSGAEIVTVALRRVDLTPGKPNVLDAIDRKRYTLLPNTAGCYTADEAVRTCRLARELGMADLVKLEVIGDPQTLFPDNAATLEAAQDRWSRRASRSCPTARTIRCWRKRLEDAGCAAVMPLAAPIGSGLGIRNPYNLRIILEQRRACPVIVDAGVGTASDAAVAHGARLPRRAHEHRASPARATRC